jgi:hypothetical protein
MFSLDVTITNEATIASNRMSMGFQERIKIALGSGIWVLLAILPEQQERLYRKVVVSEVQHSRS